MPEVSITDLTPFSARCDIVTLGEKHQKLRVGPAPCPAPKPFPTTPPLELAVPLKLPDAS